MKIFDTRWTGAHGIGRFGSELYARLDGFQPIAIGGRPAAPFDPLSLTAYLYFTKSEFFFSPGYNAPFQSSCPFVFCVHDLNHLFVRDNSSILKRAYFQHIVRRAVHRAMIVLTVSEFSRGAICDWAGVPDGHVVNVGNGISGAFREDGEMYAASRPYFLFVGNHKPHKNFDRLLEAFALSGLATEIMLLSTGTPTEELLRTIHRLGLSSDVVFLGEISDEDLAKLYRGAMALTLVSLYEGFGLPIVEAMACGTPVLCSNAASMPEVAGEAALLIDSLDVDAISHGMRRLVADGRLRERLRAMGRERSKVFSWDATALKVSMALGVVSRTPQ